MLIRPESKLALRIMLGPWLLAIVVLFLSMIFMQPSMTGQIQFEPRWREELVATSSEGKLVFEFTIAGFHVYFPDQQRWLAIAPVWAREQWQAYHDACQDWCRKNRIPISLVSDANFY